MAWNNFDKLLIQKEKQDSHTVMEEIALQLCLAHRRKPSLIANAISAIFHPRDLLAHLRPVSNFINTSPFR